MKRIVSLIMMLVILTGFFACTSDLDNTGGNIGDKVRVQMNLTGLNGFAVTRTVDQSAVGSITAYLFEGMDGSSNLKYTIPITLNEPTDAGLPGTFEVPVAGEYYIEVIANAEALTGISTYEDFLGKTTTAAFEGNLVMQGALDGPSDLVAGQINELGIALVRLAATFQVTVGENAGVTDVSVTLKNAVKSSYFVKHASEGSFTIPSDATTEDGQVPYSYENPNSTTVMLINGKLNDADYTTEVTLDKVLRNHLYTVKLVNNNGTIEPKLTVADWSVISAEMEIGAGQELKMTATTDNTGNAEPEAKVVYPAAEPLASAATVAVPVSSENVVYYIWVGSANIEAEVTNNTLPEGWTLTPPAANTRTDYLWQKGYWMLTIAPNAQSEAKTATITATNKLVGEAKVEITFELEGKEEEGIVWAPANTRSWIDAVTYDNDVYVHSYIPTIPLADQGISFVYDKSKTIFSDTDNPYAYHFQWDRDFGFKASDQAFDYAYTYLPNSSNIPNSFGPVYGGKYGYTASLTWAMENPDSFVYPTSSWAADWCSDGRSNWADRFNDYEISAAPRGYHIPTKEEWNTLLPEGKNESYTYASKGLSVEVGTSYPFFAKQLNGKTIIWSMHTETKKYLEVRTVIGSYTLNNLTSDILKQDKKPLQLPADGYRTSQGTLEWQTRGLYWASDSNGCASGYSNAFSFTIKTADKTIRVSTGEQPRKYAFSIRCIKD